MNRPGILLEVVQVLSDLDLAISKAYISSDGGWFMDGRSKREIHGFLGVDSRLPDLCLGADRR